MLFSDRPRTHYEKTLAHEVICQLRFPTILSINNVEPADFQERIREDFPQYARKQDVLPPQIVNGKPEPQPPVTNYHFLSQDGRWKLNLTKDFIALSTLSYPGWEEFARMLDKPLAAFIQLYKPAYFQRVGLRYLNIVSRTALDLEDVSWRELFTRPIWPHGGSRSVGGPGRQLRLRHAVQAGFQLHRQDPRRYRPLEDQHSPRASGPGGEVHFRHGPLHGRQHRLRSGRRRAGNPPRSLLPGIRGGHHRPSAGRHGPVSRFRVFDRKTI